MITFDRLAFDCNAVGEFTLLKSLEDPTFMIQERYSPVVNSSTCNQASVSTGIAIQEQNYPTIQISTPRNGKASLNTLNGCPIDFLIDGVETLLPVIEATNFSTWGGGTYDSGAFVNEWIDEPGHVWISFWSYPGLPSPPRGPGSGFWLSRSGHWSNQVSIRLM